MKKILLVMTFLVLSFSANAQEESSSARSEGSWMIEVNTGSLTTGSTAFSLASVDGNTAWTIGAETGYFIIDDLAIKAGLGYADFGNASDGTFSYKVGVKYYVSGNIPVGVDFTGSSTDGFSQSWVGAQAGYAIQVASNIAIEPALRYNITLDEMKADSVFQALVGFSIFL